MKAITHSISFSMLAALGMLTLLALPFTSFAATDWEAQAPTALVFTCGGGEYPHTVLTINQSESGVLTGTGDYDPDGAYTWDLAGQVTDDTVTFSITYTGAALGSVYTQTGTIALDGSVSGTSTGNCQTFTMPAGSFVVNEPEEPTDPATKEECKKGGWEDFGFKNQGQCVRFVETGKDSR